MDGFANYGENCCLRPVSTQENKHRIGLDFFTSSAGPKKLKILQLFIIRVADHRFKLEQKIRTESPCAGSILFRSHAYFPEWKSALTHPVDSVNQCLDRRQYEVEYKHGEDN